MQPEPSWLHRAREHLWLLTLTVVFLWLAASATASSTAQPTAQSSLRFFGAGIAEPGRVRVPLGPINAGRITASAPVNVSGDFTIEFWMKASAADNPAPACPNGWYYGHIIIDRDVDGAGDYGDYGIALCDGRLAAGVSVGEDDRQLVGDVVVTDGQWHHIALTRSDGGRIALFVDGAPAGSTEGPDGRVDYRVDRPTRQPDSDPYLVLGAEKHGYPGSYHYSGLLDDLRISNVARYSGPFSRPAEPHPLDAQTVALYRFDEGAGAFIGDSSNATGGPSHGTLIVRGSPAGPVWSSDTPFTSVATAPTTPGGVETALSENSEPLEATTTIAATAPTTPGGVETALSENSELLGATTTIAATPASPIIAAVPTQSAPTLPTESTRPTASDQATQQPAPVGTTAAHASTVNDQRSSAITGAPPPVSNISILVLAWIVAAIMISIVIIVGLRRRMRGL